MKVTALWYGGISYAFPAHEDAEYFPSLKEAKEAFWRRADFDPYYPCVESSEMYVYFGSRNLADERDPYPDVVLTLGPRGGVRVERC